MKSVLVSLLSFVSIALASTAWAGQNHFHPSRYLSISGLKIAVYESDGHRGPGILLIHGNTSSARSYEKVLDSTYARKHRVVAIDLPGYGKSDNAPSYNTALFANTIKMAAQQLGLSQGVLVGWSLGGDFALQASAIMPQLKGILIFGTAPVGYAPTLPAPFLTPQESSAGAAVNYGFDPNLSIQQVNDYVTAFFRPNFNNIPNFFFSDGQRTDPMTRAAVFTAATGQDPTFLDEVHIVKNLTIPLAVIHGEKETFVRLGYLTGLAPDMPTLWQNQIITVNNSGHAIQWERKTIFVNLLRDFVNDL